MSDVKDGTLRRGEGPAVSVSASIHQGTVEEVRNRVGKRAFSSYLEEALLRQMRREDLRELIEAHTAQHGEFTAAEMADSHEALYGSLAEMPEGTE